MPFRSASVVEFVGLEDACLVVCRLPDAYLHFGFGRDGPAEWSQPEAAEFEPMVPGTVEIGEGYGRLKLVPAPLSGCVGQTRGFVNGFRFAKPVKYVNFCLYVPSKNQWIKNGKDNFVLDVEALQAGCKSSGGDDFEWSSTNRAALKVGARWELTDDKECYGRFTLQLAEKENAAGWTLHWGLFDGQWRFPDCTAATYRGTKVSDKASEVPFDAQGRCLIEFAQPPPTDALAFVIRSADASTWVLGPDAKDLVFEVPEDPRAAALKRQLAEEQAAKEAERRAQWAAMLSKFKGYQLPQAEDRYIIQEVPETALSEDVGVYKGWITSNYQPPAVASDEEEDAADSPCSNNTSATLSGEISLQLHLVFCCRQELIAHWGVMKKGDGQWRAAVEGLVTSFKSTQVVNAQANDSWFSEQEGLAVVTFDITKGNSLDENDAGRIIPAAESINMVFKSTDGSKWFKNQDGSDLKFKLKMGRSLDHHTPCADLVSLILEAEVEWNSITLMHRYQMVKEKVDMFMRARHTPSGPSSPSSAPITPLLDKAGCSPRSSRTTPETRPGTTTVVNAEADYGREFWSWIFVWLRFSDLAWLDWQRKYNTRPLQLAHATQELSFTLARIWKQRPEFRLWTKLALSCVGRGGNQGQRIRDQILEIMHRHHIPETAGHFYEQWHQKLHNNTTPDDVGICKAVIKYYESNGNMGAYWGELAHHGIDKARLASYERPITQEPYLLNCDRGALLGDWYSYLNVLMDIHDSRDLHRSVDRVRHGLCGETRGAIDHLLGELNRSSQPHNAADAANRVKLIGQIRNKLHDRACTDQNDAYVRDLILLDYSLESIQSATLQNTRKDDIGLVDSISMAIIFVSQWTHVCDTAQKAEEWKALKADLESLALPAAQQQFTKDRVLDALMVKAVVDRLTRAIGDEVGLMQEMIGPKSQLLGEAVSVPSDRLNVFVDEVLRGSILFSLSQLIAVLEPRIRALAEMPPWQIISPIFGSVSGRLLSVPKLTNLQEKKYEEPTILVSGAVNGEEDIPEGVVGIIVRDAASAPDVLSHVSVRARNSATLLAVCCDATLIKDVEATYQDKLVTVQLIKGNTEVTVAPCDALVTHKSKDTAAGSGSDTKRSIADLCLDANEKVQRSPFCVLEKAYTREVVGSKSFNLKVLREQLSSTEYQVPSSLAFIYGSFLKALNHPLNEWVKQEMEALKTEGGKAMKPKAIKRLFETFNKLVTQMSLPDELADEFNACLDDATCSSMKTAVSKMTAQMWYTALKEVWASVYNMRPWVALAKANRSWTDLSMAVLVQEMVHARYAFVLHSKHPYRENGNEFMYGEIVKGLGETLVGNCPGRALSWECEKATGKVRIVAWPAKSKYLSTAKEGTLCFRSDSNGEDLEGFAGAGLFDTVPVVANEERVATYSTDKLVVDRAYRESVLAKLSKCAWDLQRVFGDKPMDVEGCIAPDDSVVVVQCRPQV